MISPVPKTNSYQFEFGFLWRWMAKKNNLPQKERNWWKLSIPLRRSHGTETVYWDILRTFNDACSFTVLYTHTHIPLPQSSNISSWFFLPLWCRGCWDALTHSCDHLMYRWSHVFWTCPVCSHVVFVLNTVLQCNEVFFFYNHLCDAHQWKLDMRNIFIPSTV